MGSCFSENMGEKLIHHGFHTIKNPFGILYQPSAILRALRRIMQVEYYTPNELIFHQNLFHSPDHHGSYSGTDANAVIHRINDSIEKANHCLMKENALLLITFGSNIGYIRKEDGRPFSNCHKIPGQNFEKVFENQEDIRKNWNEMLFQLHRINPSLKIIFTVSPVRHWKDGAVENQLSKATLLVCLHEWVKNYDFCHYFPAYEIMMDELRDYRFYKEDMLHPSTQAENYIWDKFAESCIDQRERPLMRRINDLYLQLNHRPIHPENPELKTEIHKLALQLETLECNAPFPDLQLHKEMLQQKTKLYV